MFGAVHFGVIIIDSAERRQSSPKALRASKVAQTIYLRFENIIHDMIGSAMYPLSLRFIVIAIHLCRTCFSE